MRFPEKPSGLPAGIAAAYGVFLDADHALQGVGELVTDHGAVAGSVGMYPHGADGIAIGTAKGPAGRTAAAPGIIHHDDQFILTQILSSSIGTEADLCNEFSVDLLQGIADRLRVEAEIRV